MTDDSDLFRTRKQLEDEGWQSEGNVFTQGGERMLPLYEAKMVDFFNHRAADVVKSLTALNRQNQPRYLSDEELRDPARLAIPSLGSRSTEQSRFVAAARTSRFRVSACASVK